MDAALARLRRTYERMDSEIERSGGPWLLGKKITLADVAVMPALVRMHDLGLPDWQDLPRVVTWFDNIRAQPAFKPTYYQGSLLSERFPHLREKERVIGYYGAVFRKQVDRQVGNRAATSVWSLSKFENGRRDDDGHQ